MALTEQHKISQAKEHFLEGVRIQTELVAEDKENLGEEYGLADCYLEFGKAMVKSDLPAESFVNLEKAIEIYRRIWQKDTSNLLVRHRIANSQRFLADAFSQKGNLPAAKENYDQAHAVFLELTSFDPENIDWQQDLAMSYRRLGEIALKKKDSSQASTNFRLASPIFERLAANSPENVKRKSELETINALVAENRF